MHARAAIDWLLTCLASWRMPVRTAPAVGGGAHRRHTPHPNQARAPGRCQFPAAARPPGTASGEGSKGISRRLNTVNEVAKLPLK